MPSPSAPQRPDAIGIGILLMLSSVAVFAVMDMLIKWLGPVYPVGQVIFFRSVFALLPLSYLIWKAGGIGSLRTPRLSPHLFRSLVGLTSMGCFFWSFAVLPLAEVVAIGQAGPIILTALSVPLLKEKVGPRRWAAVIIGFLGVLLITRPGTALFDPRSLVPLAGAFGYALAMVAIRQLSFSEPSHRIVFYFSAFGATLGLLTLPLSWLPWEVRAFGLAATDLAWVTPSLADLALLVLIGILGGCGQILMTRAFSNAPAGLLAPFEYTSLAFAMLFGYLFWGELIDQFTLGGAAIIILSGLYILHRERVVQRRRAAPFSSHQVDRV